MDWLKPIVAALINEWKQLRSAYVRAGILLVAILEVLVLFVLKDQVVGVLARLYPGRENEAFLVLVFAILPLFSVLIVVLSGLIIVIVRTAGLSWNKVLKPFLKYTAISLTLIIPNGIIIWYFVFRVAVDLTPIIRNREVFLSVVAWLTGIVSAYSLLWGMWLYPTIIRPLFNKRKTKKPAKENKVNEDEVDENKNQDQSVQSPNVAELNQPLNNQGGGTL